MLLRVRFDGIAVHRTVFERRVSLARLPSSVVQYLVDVVANQHETNDDHRNGNAQNNRGSCLGQHTAVNVDFCFENIHPLHALWTGTAEIRGQQSSVVGKVRL